MTPLELTLKNLQKVADEFPALVEKYPRIRDHFNMSQFGVLDRDRLGEAQPVNECNTTGCFLGWIAYLFEYNDIRHYAPNPFERGVFIFDYGLFGRNIFPAMFTFESEKKDLPAWDYLFSGEWGWSLDGGTIEAALERVNTLLELNKDNVEEIIVPPYKISSWPA